MVTPSSPGDRGAVPWLIARAEPPAVRVCTPELRLDPAVVGLREWDGLAFIMSPNGTVTTSGYTPVVDDTDGTYDH